MQRSHQASKGREGCFRKLIKMVSPHSPSYQEGTGRMRGLPDFQPWACKVNDTILGLLALPTLASKQPKGPVRL
jgi:hypothetical protein